MNRTPVLPILLGAHVAGVVSAAVLGGPWPLTFALGGLVGSALLLRRGTPAIAAIALLIIVAATIGHWRLERLDAAPPPPLAAMTGTHEVTGVARDDAVIRGSTLRVDLGVETVDGEPMHGAIRISTRNSVGVVRAGDRIRLVVDLETPPSAEAFDYRAYLRDRDIHLVGAFPTEWEHIGATDRGWRGRLEQLHREVVRRIGRALPEPEASLAAGVLVGEQGSLPDDVDEALRATGTTHLVVVSGQNVAVIIGIAIAALTAFVSRRTASLCALVLLPGYVVFVGADPPVVRAAIMAVAVIAAGVTGRRTPAWVYLVYAAGVMLILDPVLVRDVSFQLSAMATVGITTLAPALRDAVLARFPWLTSPGRAAVVGVTATATGAALAVLPVQVATFEVIAPWTILANVAVAPVYEATVFAAALAALVGDVGPLGLALTIAPRAFLWLVEVLARLPGAQIAVELPLVAGAVFLGLLVAATARLATYARSATAVAVLDGGISSRFTTTVGLALVAGGLWWTALAPSEAFPSVTVLDVGQGLAVLVRDGDATLLIDSGPRDGAVLAALGREGVTQLDAVVLTHNDLDHTGGLAALRERLDVDAVYVEASTVALYDGVQPIDIGDRFGVGAITVEVIGPPVATRDYRLASDNNGSLVLLVAIGDRRVLVTADIEAPAEAWLVASGVDLHADVLVVPHHGSNTSSTQGFIEAVAPRVAVVPVGQNPYGHPNAEVLARYEGDESISLYRTDEDGAITLTSDSEHLWLRAGGGR